MAEKQQLENEVIEVLKHAENGRHFLLSGGAGSGKTYSLVQVIKEIIRRNPKSQIACITYTNAAVKEIQERVDHNNLRVSTIHDFLWDMIKAFQKEIKACLLELINDPNNRIPNPNADNNPYLSSFEEGIQYQVYLSISKGVISHDEVLLLANVMYKKHKRLCDILKDKYKYIFIDEYQDTSPLVIEILLDHIQKSKKECVVGFFGDSMQSIYDNGVGDLDSYIQSQQVAEVKKLQNRRNPQSVIDLANKLRLDSLRQEASRDDNAPNMQNGVIKQGRVTFVYSRNTELDKVKKNIFFQEWDFSDAQNTRELNLTHNLIVTKAKFRQLMDIYDKDPFVKLKNDIVQIIKKENRQLGEDITFAEAIERVPIQNKTKQLRINQILNDPDHSALYADLYDFLKDRPFTEVRKIYFDKDSLIDDKKDDPDDNEKKGSKRDNLTSHIFKIQELIYYYESKDYNTFLRKTDYKIYTVVDKKRIREIIETVKGMSESTTQAVIDFADAEGLCKKDDRFNDFCKNNSYLFYRVAQVEFKEFQHLYYYLEGFTPFSTQHKIKGAEYSKVLVILDNGRWFHYDYDCLFGCGTKTENVIKRTRKLFYVCCTRAKDDLVIYYQDPSQEVIDSAKAIFGESNVRNLDSR